MRITDAYTRLGLQGPTGPARGAAGRAQGTDAPAAAETEDLKVNVSDRAQALSRQTAEEASAARVERLRTALADGTFQVDPQVIADRLVRGG
ncbi:MAG: flagellar biosynthesis anti-sigma factor FlgM [Deltaproteobacteria bacterium]|nr:flagellar biosynthesis anti-sigma factor FlgM [Deltaproteobacteria bacterium]